MEMIEVLVPGAGESITEVQLAAVLVENGSVVEKNQEIAEVDSDKATLPINAPASGKITFFAQAGETLKVGSVLARIDTSVSPQEKPSSGDTNTSANEEKVQSSLEIEKAPKAAKPDVASKETVSDIVFTPQASRLLEEQGINLDEFFNTLHGKRITKKEVLIALSGRAKDAAVPQQPGAKEVDFWASERQLDEVKMSTLRKKIAQRLVAVKNQTAMLTTFNEVDMSALMKLRSQNQKAFQEKYGAKLSFMSFFTKAVTNAIPYFPQVNGAINGDSIVTYKYADIGIAVSTPKGLMVPVVRNAHLLDIPAIEIEIARLAAKARDNKISMEDLEGGTFSITNGGVFGSMLSTPIINPPQSAILGMHNIVERPVAIDGKVEIRPIMYVALSYDHRIIDGKESVGFLKKVKECLENPELLFTKGKSLSSALLGL